MYYTIKAFIKKEGCGYFAECSDIAVVARGFSLDETVENLRNEIRRCLKSIDRSRFEISEDPELFITFEDVQIPG